MFSILSAILHLGNIEIADDSDGNAALGNDKHLQVVEDPILIHGMLAQSTP
jgi:myosin heavy subunit